MFDLPVHRLVAGADRRRAARENYEARITGLRRLAPAQRDAIVEQVLRSDPELGKVLPAMLSLYRSAKFQRRLGPLIRDSVT